ncbi:cytosine permease [Agrococcus sediminis]|uniref:cytosine permease n=1 Tax=Agrococcus TaxID=46352 RepID=UPI000FE3C361|nr:MULTISPECIES: cytosine permease [unclassified Agrococcus]MDR7233511.1 cytosine permease [Agrococcus sp. BE272]RWR24661.1 cytosine permease [Agrococcus lahaulensis]UOW01939.1 cytosine permease [Agrococcus sp. SCSIO52902]
MTTTASRPEAIVPEPDDAQPVRIDTDYPLTRVPLSARQGWFGVLVVVAGFLFFTPTMVTGGAVAGAFGFAGFVGIAIVASIVLALYVATLGAVSARTGLSTVLLARLVLGRVGGKWASIVLGGTQIGWYGITVGIFANLLATALGWDVTWPLAIFGGLLMATTAYWGFKGIEILSWVSVPLMLGLCFWVMGLSVGEVGGWANLWATEGDASIAPGMALTMMIGTFISGGTQIGNWTRFSKKAGTAFLTCLGVVVVIEFALLFFGGIGAIAFAEPDFTNLLLGLGLALLAVFMLVFNLWTTNDNAAYAFGVAGAELFGVANKRPFIIGGVVIGIALAVTNAADAMTGFLVLLGTVIPPLGGAVIGTFLFTWRLRDPGTHLGTVPAFQWAGIAAYLAGTAAAFFGSFTGIGSPALQGIIVAILAVPVASAIARAVRKPVATGAAA